MADNERGKSIVNVIPRGNNVLVKMTFKESILGIRSGKPSKASEAKVTFTIVGIGPQVKDLEIGEEVIMELMEYADVPVEGNYNGIKNLLETYRKMSNQEFQTLLESDQTNKVDVIQYGLFSEFQIKAVVK